MMLIEDRKKVPRSENVENRIKTTRRIVILIPTSRVADQGRYTEKSRWDMLAPITAGTMGLPVRIRGGGALD